VLSLGVDFRNGVKTRFNFDLTDFQSDNTAIQVGTNWEVYSFNTCGFVFAKLEIAARWTAPPVPPKATLGLEATVLGVGKLTYTVFPTQHPFF
jgi:hypothetical protein